MTSKQLSEQLKQVRRYEKQLKELNKIRAAVSELHKANSRSLDFILQNMTDNFDDSFFVALENEITRTEHNLESWGNIQQSA